jgi:hypothetical protein
MKLGDYLAWTGQGYTEYPDIELLNAKECLEIIKGLDLNYNFGKPLTSYTDEIDRVVNLLLDLEQRISYCDPNSATGQPLRSGMPGAREQLHMRTPKGVYRGVSAAAEATGYAKNTLLSYITNKPDQYFWVEDHPNRETGFEVEDLNSTEDQQEE